MNLINIIDTTGEHDNNNTMRITFKDYATRTNVTTELTNGELIEYNGKTWQVSNVAKTMCRITPVNHNELPTFIHYERLFN